MLAASALLSAWALAVNIAAPSQQHVPVFYNGAKVIAAANSKRPSQSTMPPPGHTGVVLDTMPGIAGLVYVRWDPGSTVASGHYMHDEIDLHDSTSLVRHTAEDKGWSNGCDADPARRSVLLDLLSLKGTYAMQRGGTYTHGLNHELGNFISMLRVAVSTGRKLLLWTDEGPRLHRKHHMDQEYDEMLGSWQGFVDFETSFFVINETMLLTALGSPARPRQPLPLSPLPPCLFWSDLVEFADPKSVVANDEHWCHDRFDKMKQCRQWGVHHNHTSMPPNSYVEIDEKTDPRDYTNVHHVVQEAGREKMQRKAPFVRGLGKRRDGQPPTYVL